MRIRRYGWIFAGPTSLVFSALFFVFSVSIWVISALALKNYLSPDCTIHHISDKVTTHKCVDGFIPVGQVKKCFLF